ncbi:hypothetical protein N7478_011579 [Penicillium angulare]|uniref:uncharacterized protein n=1 Tax=Penicillium angulare TaxID=116970 RepID=UPI00254219B0|nr:uncharacterized protein N7478_011579 [Penicillium angulare]KAJ5260984.1 hypothetical protein N7478_011579 [Penicillium angulare]
MLITGHSAKVSDGLIDRMSLACNRTIDYLAYSQEPTGVWYGRWGSNYIYGTSNVLCGLTYFVEKETGTIEINDVIKGFMESVVDWLKLNQNHDGGWGETLISYKDIKLGGNSPSTVL